MEKKCFKCKYLGAIGTPAGNERKYCKKKSNQEPCEYKYSLSVHIDTMLFG